MRTNQGTAAAVSSLVRLVAVLMLASCACAEPSLAADGGSSAPKVFTMKIRLITEDAVLTATLEASAATRDFVAMLPLTLTLRDYAGTEKVSDLPKRLSTSGTPPGMDPAAGDVAYFAPWGNLAIFYRDFGYSSGLVKLGHIHSGLEKLAKARGDVVVRIELADEIP